MKYFRIIGPENKLHIILAADQFEAIYRAKIRDGHAYPQNSYKVIRKKADVAKK